MDTEAIRKAFKVKNVPAPIWICHDCGTKYGDARTAVSTWHDDECDVCHKKNIPVTESRDYNYLPRLTQGEARLLKERSKHGDK